MPAIYAHYRFGKQVLPALSADVRQCIQRFRRLYDAGLHGPDFFFYYNPFFQTAVGDLGGKYHHQSGQVFFAQACTQADSEAARAYLYGLLGHYCLDSACHPFVERMVTIGEAGHVALESEFERHLLQKDGLLPPHAQDRTRHLKLTRGEYGTVARFYPPATAGNVSRSMKLMVFCNKFLTTPNREQKEALLKKLKPSLQDHFIPEEEVADFAFMIGELQELYDGAVLRYPVLLQQLQEHMRTGEPLSTDFAPNFG